MHRLLRHNFPWLLVLLATFLSGCIERKPANVNRRESPISAELQSMLEEHESMRAMRNTSPALIAEADLRHRQTVYQFLARGLVIEAADLYNSAILLQSGDSATCRENAMLAYYCATEAAAKGYTEARYLAAVCIDKYLVASGLRQKYGTQVKREASGKYVLSPYDTTTTDADRALWNVPKLDSLKAIADAMSKGRFETPNFY